MTEINKEKLVAKITPDSPNFKNFERKILNGMFINIDMMLIINCNFILPIPLIN